MLGLSRLIQRCIENPKILIAYGVLIALGVIVHYAVFAAPDNPLPDPESVQAVSFFPGHVRADSPGKTIDIALYRELCASLSGCERLIQSGAGEMTGTIVIRRTDGSTCRAVLYEWGLVQTDDGLFMGVDSEQINRVSSAIKRISGWGSFALR